MESINDFHYKEIKEINDALTQFGGLTPEIVDELANIRSQIPGQPLLFLVGVQAKKAGKHPSDLFREISTEISRQTQYTFMEFVGRVPFRP